MFNIWFCRKQQYTGNGYQKSHFEIFQELMYSANLQSIRRLQSQDSTDFADAKVIVDAQNREWCRAQDPRSGKYYYYDPITKETTWNKPLDARKSLRDAHFFDLMERNIRHRLRQGKWSCGVSPKPSEPSVAQPTKKTQLAARPKLFRTLSSVDDITLTAYSKAAGQRPSPIAETTSIKTITMDDILEKQRKLETKQEETSTNIGRKRANTTSTIYVRMGIMSAPDLDATVQCVCTVLRAHMLEGQADSKTYKMFDTLPHEKPSKSVPSLESLAKFMHGIYKKAQLESECIIMSLIYVERLLKATNGELELRPNNWKAILFCSMVMASKVWDDLSMWNSDFSKICPPFTLQRVNQLELAYLNAVQYRVRVAASSYAKYYFHLRAMCKPLGVGNIDESPLDFPAALKIQGLSESLEGKVKDLPSPRKRGITLSGVCNQSLNDIKQKGYRLSSVAAPRVCIEHLVHMDVRSVDIQERLN